MKLSGKTKWIAMSALGLAVIGCGKPVDSKAKASLTPAASVPGPSVSGGTISSVAPSLAGTYKLNQHACYDSSGNFNTQDSAIADETLTIGSTSYVTATDMGDGCVVSETYDVLGATSSRITLGNLRVTMTFYGQPDTGGDCANDAPPASAPGQTWNYNWVQPSGQFALLSAPTGYCQSNEFDADLFDKTN